MEEGHLLDCPRVGLGQGQLIFADPDPDPPDPDPDPPDPDPDPPDPS